MKKNLISICVIITHFILMGNVSFAIDKSSIQLENDPHILNTEKNIDHAMLIENDVIKFKQKLLRIQTNYKLVSDKKIIVYIKDLDEIIYILRKIQTTKVNKKTAEIVIQTVIVDLKNINFKIKPYLHTIQAIDKEKIEKYHLIVDKLVESFDVFTRSFTQYYSSRTNISKKDKKIIKELQYIRSFRLSLIKLKTKKHNNSYSYRNELITILRDIRISLIQIKNFTKQ